MGNKIIDSNEMGLIIQLGIKNYNHKIDTMSSLNNTEPLHKENAGEIIFRERRHKKANEELMIFMIIVNLQGVKCR